MGRKAHLLFQMDDITFWNVRSLNAYMRQYGVKQFIVRNKVRIMCLLETHVKSKKKKMKY